MALALGRTVGELEREMGARELFEWQLFCAEHPLPFEIADFHGARLAALLININRANGTAAVAAADYMLLRERAKKAEPKTVPGKPVLTMAQRMKAIAEGRQ